MLFVARSFARIGAFDSSIRPQGRKNAFCLLPNVDLALTLLSFRAAPVFARMIFRARAVR